MLLLQKAWALLRRIFCDREQKNQEPTFPSSFFRGISAETDVDRGVFLKASAFQFGEVPEERTDNNRELSIIWNDCEDSLDTLLRQRNKKGNIQFSSGYATIKLSRFEDTVINYIAGNMVGYERKPITEDVDKGIEANPYHGNILLHNSASDQLKKNIQHSLATIAVFTRRPDSIINPE